MTVHASEEQTIAARAADTCKLPPLILHPFSDQSGPNKLIESSRATLKIQGMLPTGQSTRKELDGTLLEGRYSELRMLYYVGKDINRWIEQCMDFVARKQLAVPAGITPQSFVTLLVQDTPAPVVEKLRRWGVGDYRSLFSRALSLHTIFSEVPTRAALADEFVRNYYRYSDHLFSSCQSQTSFAQLDPAQFQFDLYSSGEYVRKLEREWDSEAGL